jgi:hypothetical protein
MGPLQLCLNKSSSFRPKDTGLPTEARHAIEPGNVPVFLERSSLWLAYVAGWNRRDDIDLPEWHATG